MIPSHSEADIQTLASSGISFETFMARERFVVSLHCAPLFTPATNVYCIYLSIQCDTSSYALALTVLSAGRSIDIVYCSKSILNDVTVTSDFLRYFICHILAIVVFAIHLPYIQTSYPQKSSASSLCLGLLTEKPTTVLEQLSLRRKNSK